MNTVTINDVGIFLNLIIRAYDDYLFIAFVMMIVFNIGIFIKYIVSGTR